MMIKTQLSKFFAIETKDQNRYKKLNNQAIKNEQVKNVDVDSNISEKKSSMARITQNRQIGSPW